MSTYVYKIADKFTRVPGPRHRSQGAKSGEAFREIVARLLKEHDHVTIDMNGVEGFGSSFLNEAFAKLVSEENLSHRFLHDKLTLVWKDALQLSELWKSIDETKPEDRLARAS